MALDAFFWGAVQEKLRLGKFYPDSKKPFWQVHTEPATPQDPDFPRQARDYSGALLFDSNSWVEEQLYLPPQPVFDNSKHATDSFLLKSCALLPIERAIFQPTCPVLQHEPRIQLLGVEAPIVETPPTPSLLDRPMDFIYTNPVFSAFASETLFLALVFWFLFKGSSSSVSIRSTESATQTTPQTTAEVSTQTTGQAPVQAPTQTPSQTAMATNLRRQTVLSSFLTVMFKITHREKQAAASLHLTELRQQKAVASLQLNELRQQKAVAYKLYQCFRFGYTQLREKCSKLEGLVMSLTAEKVTLEKDKKDLEQQLDVENLEAQKSREENVTLSSEKSKLTTDLKAKCEEVKLLQDAKASAENLRQELDTLNSKNTSLAADLQAKAAELEELKTARDEAEADLQEQIDQLSRDLKTRDVGYAALQSSLRQSQSEAAELRNAKAAIEAELQETTAELRKELQETDAKLNQDAEFRNETLRELQVITTGLEQEVNEVNSKHQLKDEENAELKQRLAALEKEQARELAVRDREIASLKEQLEEGDVEVETLKDAQIEADNDAETLREDLTSQTAKAEAEQQRLRSGNEDLHAKLSRAETEAKDLQDKLNSQSDTAQSEQQRVVTENQQLQEKLDRAEAEAESLQHKLDSQSSNAHAEKQRLLTEKQELSDGLNRAEAELEEKDTRLNASAEFSRELLAKNNEIDERLYRIVGENPAKINELTEANKQLDAENQELKEKVNRAETEHGEKESSLSELTEVNEQSLVDNEEVEAELSRKDVEVKEKEQDEGDLEISQPKKEVEQKPEQSAEKKSFFQTPDEMYKGMGSATGIGDLAISRWAHDGINTTQSPSPPVMQVPNPPTSSKPVQKKEFSSSSHAIDSKWAPKVKQVEAPSAPKALVNSAPPPSAPTGPKALRTTPTGPKKAYRNAASAQLVSAASSLPTVATEPDVAAGAAVGESVGAAAPQAGPAQNQVRRHLSQLHPRGVRYRVLTPQQAATRIPVPASAVSPAPPVARPAQDVASRDVQGSRWANGPASVPAPASAPRGGNRKKKPMTRMRRTASGSLLPEDCQKILAEQEEEL
ncbi:hypothetical protein H2200_003814 [Cladophialophora chaetospira]|uniref:Uncharacterized protein n=1 Tax=Cladophialophora chaetospira TaxID=386627 RepID=A0AA39CL35_9EURO|nr:hypothetical protein H2200_003814 [Cladophialophora chaetospira]